MLELKHLRLALLKLAHGSHCAVSRLHEVARSPHGDILARTDADGGIKQPVAKLVFGRAVHENGQAVERHRAPVAHGPLSIVNAA